MSYYTLGHYDKNKGGHDENYYKERYCVIDYRGPLSISPESYFGFGVKVITLSHVISGGMFDNKTVGKPVTIGDYAWIASYAILYNCIIKHHGIVSLGSVVHSMIVEPYTVVAGNPAVPIMRWDLEKKKWVKLSQASRSRKPLDI